MREGLLLGHVFQIACIGVPRHRVSDTGGKGNGGLKPEQSAGLGGVKPKRLTKKVESPHMQWWLAGKPLAEAFSDPRSSCDW